MEKKNEKLFALLASYYALESKLRCYHWNVSGINFASLHKLFEEQYDVVAEEIDVIAEQIKKLGDVVEGNMKTYLDFAIIDVSNGASNTLNMIDDLMVSNEKICKYIKELKKHIEENKDEEFKKENESTLSLLDDLLKVREKDAWFLRASAMK